MRELKINSALETFKVNGVNGECEISFCPTDMYFVEKIYDIFENLDERQNKLEQAMSKAEGRGIFAVARKADAEMREIIDELLGANASSMIYGNTHLYASADGLPLWADLLLAILDSMEAANIREKAATNPRIAKYTSKYHK